FWLGEAPGRTAELSLAVSQLRADVEKRFEEAGEQNKSDGTRLEQTLAEWLKAETGLSDAGSRQLEDYFTAIFRTLGVIPSQQKLVMERFFDESGGMQLVIH